MSSETATSPAERLRREFDATFAHVPAAGAAQHLDFLSIRAGDRPYALRLSEIAGLAAGKALTPLPRSAPGLAGIAGFRGLIIPVYDLAVLLGHGPGESLRWLALTGGVVTVGLAFDKLEAHVRVAEDEIATEEGEVGPGRQVLRREALPVLEVATVVETITEQVDRIKEQ